jgi:glutathione S-transferase
MKLIGMLDSPYVRRVAIALKVLKLEFQHESVSVFSTFEQFRQINPVVKAPTLVLDDGLVLMDSSLLLTFVDPQARLWPTDPAARARAFRLTGLALAGCDKAVQVVYEHNLRPAEKLHEPWLLRVHGQLAAAWSELERELNRQPLSTDEATLGQAEISIAVAWSFARMMVPELAQPDAYPALATFTHALEQLPVFVQTPAV